MNRVNSIFDSLLVSVDKMDKTGRLFEGMEDLLVVATSPSFYQLSNRMRWHAESQKFHGRVGIKQVPVLAVSRLRFKV
jgi:hypothetical protein